jgi:hypothetical protein
MACMIYLFSNYLKLALIAVFCVVMQWSGNLTVNMEAIRSSETLVSTHKFTRCHNPEDHIPHLHHSETQNMRFNIVFHMKILRSVLHPGFEPLTAQLLAHYVGISGPDPAIKKPVGNFGGLLWWGLLHMQVGDTDTRLPESRYCALR